MQTQVYPPTLSFTLDTHLVTAGVLIFIDTFVVMTPVIHFIIAGWAAKRKDIMDSFDASARFEYFKMFSRSIRCVNAEAAVEEFAHCHSRWYGWNYFIAPFSLLFLTSVIGVAAIAFTGLNKLGYQVFNIAALPDTAMAAFAGAYLWVADDLILRARRLDMAPSDLMWATLRLAILIPMGYAFAAVLMPALAHLTAFALGAFPLSGLISIMRRLAIKSITTITHIAYCDPVRLIMRSSMTLFCHRLHESGSGVDVLADGSGRHPRFGNARCCGDSLFVFWSWTMSTQRIRPSKKQCYGGGRLSLIAAKINQDPKTLQVVFRQIAADPFTLVPGEGVDLAHFPMVCGDVARHVNLDKSRDRNGETSTA